jgi:hypothetical protein
VIEPPQGAPSPRDLADWAELSVLFGDRNSLAFNEALDIFAETYGDDLPDEQLLDDELLEDELSAFAEPFRPRVDEVREASAEGMTEAEARWTSLLTELSFREQIVGDAYPIAIESDGLTLRRATDDEPIYAFIALAGGRLTYGLADAVPVHEPAKLFEQVVATALGKYVGGTGLRFGWPRISSEPVEDFRAKVARLANRMGESVGLMRNVGPDDKDHQLDVIAWRGFDDSLPLDVTPGQSVIVCQCGIGSNWHGKALVAAIWAEIINFTITPTGALAFPVVPSRNDDDLYTWHDICASGNIPFDRLRIASLITAGDLEPSVKRGLIDWMATASQALPMAER